MKRPVWCVCPFLLLAGCLPVAAAVSCPAPARPALTAVPGRPFSAVSSSDGCWVFVSLSDGRGHGSIAVLRNVQGSFTLVRTVASSAAALGEALAPDGQLLALTVRDGVDLIDVSRLEQPTGDPIVARLGYDGGGPIYDVISRDGQLLFVSDEDANRISVFNLALARNPQHRGDALIGQIPTAGAPVGLAVSPDGKWLYATSEVGQHDSGLPDRCAPHSGYDRRHPVGVLLKIDVAKATTDPRESVVAVIPAGCDTVRVAVSPSGEALWVTARGDDALLRIDAAGLSRGGGVQTLSIPIGTEPVGVAVRPDGEQVWVALSSRFERGRPGGLAGIAGIANPGKIELMSAPTGGFPRELSFLPDGRTLVVTLFRSRAVEFMPTPP